MPELEQIHTAAVRFVAATQPAAAAAPGTPAAGRCDGANGEARVSDLEAILRTFRFESWWWLGLLLLLPIWAWLRGRVAPVAAVEFSSGELLRGSSRKPRFHSRQWLMALRYLALALLIERWHGRKWKRACRTLMRAGSTLCSCWTGPAR